MEDKKKIVKISSKLYDELEGLRIESNEGIEDIIKRLVEDYKEQHSDLTETGPFSGLSRQIGNISRNLENSNRREGQ
jgi:hypothetical protein